MPVCIVKYGTHTRTEPRARRITYRAGDIIAATDAELAEFPSKFEPATPSQVRAYAERLVAEQESFTAPPPEPEPEPVEVEEQAEAAEPEAPDEEDIPAEGA